MPTRHQFSEEGVYANLDQLIAEPLPFRVHGKVHILKPVTTEEFYFLTNALSRLYTLRDQEKGVKADELIEAYFQVVSSICSTITRKDIEDMTQPQIGALYSLVLEHATGRSQKIDHEELKKKTFQMLTPTNP